MKKVKVPKYVATLIKNNKDHNVRPSYIVYKGVHGQYGEDFADWIMWDNEETFFRAWYDGYEVEEKRYLAYLANDEGNFLKFADDGSWAFDDLPGHTVIAKTEFTKAELAELLEGAFYKCTLDDDLYSSEEIEREWINPLIELVEVI